VDPDLMKLIMMFDNKQVDCVLDVGANVGQYADAVRGAGYQGRIVSFEPQGMPHAELAAAAAADPFWEVPPPMALGDEEGEVTIHVSNRSDMSSVLPMSDATLAALPKSYYTGEVEKVPCHRLDGIFDEYVKTARHSFLKIDSQGYEWKILQGAEKCIDKLTGIQLEMSLVEMYEGEKLLSDLTNLLKNRGFDLHMLIPGYFSKKLKRQMQVDGIFFRG